MSRTHSQLIEFVDPSTRPSLVSDIFCPPLTGAGNASGERLYRRCLPRVRGGSYQHSLQQASATLRLFWVAAINHQTRRHAKRRYTAFLHLLETVHRLECVALFVGCFLGGILEELQASERLCNVFRWEVADAAKAELDMALGTTMPLETDRDLPWKPDWDTRGHPCYDEGNLFGVDFGFTVQRMSKLHNFIRWQAVAPASDLVTKTISEIRDVAFDLSFGPFLLPVSGATEVPDLWMSAAHSPEGVCGRSDLPKWSELRNMSLLLSALKPWRNGWIVNIGAGDGSCVIRAFGEAVDPANCFFWNGRSGIAFEGNHEFRSLFLQRFGSRGDIKLHFGFNGPGVVANIVAEHASQAPLGEPVDLLKVDVDNCDCCFLEAVLQRGVRPRFVHVEVHSLVPPPIVFRPRAFNPSARSSLEELSGRSYRRGHMLHCSLSAFMEILEPLDYELIRIFHFDAIFAHAPVVERLRRRGRLYTRQQTGLLTSDEIEKLWLGGFYCQPLRSANLVELTYQYMFLYDYRRWQDARLSPFDRLEIIKSYLEHWNIPRGRYTLGLHQSSNSPTHSHD